MATFEQQVEYLTGITISSSSTYPTQDQVTQFLHDGVIDVTSRCISINPKEANKFSRRSGETTSQGYDPGGAQILSVIRESGTNNDWRPCRYIDASLQSRVTDSDSLLYSSKFNPAYTIEDDGKIYVYPEPGSDPDAYKVYFVNSSPIDGDGNPLTFADSTLGSFPNNKVYLVVIYASIKSLENAMAAKGIPTISGDGTAPIELTDVSALDTDNTIDTHADQGEIDQWWSTAGHLIEGAEDLEMASSQLQKISAYIQAYSAQLQGNNTDYQWMQGRHQILSKQYETAFAIMRPAQPQQGAR